MNSGIGIAFLPGNPKHFGAFTSASKTKKITDGCIRQPETMMMQGEIK